MVPLVKQKEGVFWEKVESVCARAIWNQGPYESQGFVRVFEEYWSLVRFQDVLNTSKFGSERFNG